MLQNFLVRAREVGAHVHLADDQGDAAAIVVGIARGCRARSAAVSEDLGPLRDAVGRALQANGVALIDGPSPDAIANADLGVTGVALAIAETGSIVVAGNALGPRLATMLPPVHVALVARDQLVVSLEDAAEYLRTAATDPRDPVRYASFVTGPSRTADVEKTLVVGVHGPRELHIVLLVEAH